MKNSKTQITSVSPRAAGLRDICCICNLNVRNATDSPEKSCGITIYKKVITITNQDLEQLNANAELSVLEIYFIFLNNKSTFYVPRPKPVFQIYQTLELIHLVCHHPTHPFINNFIFKLYFNFAQSLDQQEQANG